MATEPEEAQFNEPRPKAKEDLKCPICLEYLRDPKLLPCLHSYCNRCLLGIEVDGSQMKCPKCRSCHEIPDGGVEGFPQDQVLANSLQMIEFQSNDDKKKAIPCNMCTEDDPATAHCSTCGNFLCDFCLKYHKRQVNYRSHKTISLDELDKESIRSLDRPNHCDTHVGEALKLYCKTCDQLICRDCTIVDHRSHEYGFTSQQRPVVEKNVLKSVNVLGQKAKEFKKLLTLIEALERSREAHSTSLEGEINTAFDTYVKRLELHRKKLLEDIKSARDTDMKQIWAQQEFIETTIAGLSSALRYTEQMSSCPNDSAMLAMNSKVTPQLQKLEAITWDISTIELAEPLSCVSTPLEVESAITLQNMRAGTQKPIVNVVSNTGDRASLGQLVSFGVNVGVGERTLSMGKPSIAISCGQRSVTDFNLSDIGGGMWTVEFSPPITGVFYVDAIFGDSPYLITALCASQKSNIATSYHRQRLIADPFVELPMFIPPLPHQMEILERILNPSPLPRTQTPQIAPVQLARMQTPQIAPVQLARMQTPQFAPVQLARMQTPRTQTPQIAPVQLARTQTPQIYPLQLPRTQTAQNFPSQLPGMQPPQLLPTQLTQPPQFLQHQQSFSHRPFRPWLHNCYT